MDERSRRKFCRPGLFGILALLASCDPPSVAVRDAWVRATGPDQTSTAMYLTIENAGGADRLTSVALPQGGEATLHFGTNAGGIARMRPMSEGLAIASGTEIQLRPGGDHVMIMGLAGPLREGDAVPVVLHFEKAGDRQIAARVEAADADSRSAGR